MQISREDCCVLIRGNGGWAFEPLATKLGACLRIDISNSPRKFNYVLFAENSEDLTGIPSFIPLHAIQIASDKRLIAREFAKSDVPTPETLLFEDFEQTKDFVKANPAKSWCLKYPTGCGANGHRMIKPDDVAPVNWPRPFVVQEFIVLSKPEVYRTYCAGGRLFGWVVRRFPKSVEPSPWVAHAQGAQYAVLHEAPPAALAAARSAFTATNLFDTFGCVDLLCKPDGDWVVLEVGTDGLFNHVDRDIGNAAFENEISHRISLAFWQAAANLQKTI
jgi:glutathione synthase/RimK-type ligase-like ATP-grasp enzyme